MGRKGGRVDGGGMGAGGERREGLEVAGKRAGVKGWKGRAANYIRTTHTQTWCRILWVVDLPHPIMERSGG